MFGQGRDTASLHEIRAKYTDFEIVTRFLNISAIPYMISSPLREDKNPSLAIYESKNNPGNINWKDFGTNEGGNIYNLLSRIWNLSMTQTYRKILDEMPQRQVMTLLKRKTTPIVYHKSAGSVNVKVREWQSWDLDYWSSYGITKEWLEYGDVYPISHIIITKKDNSIAFPADKYAYVYVERKDGIVTLKIYQPYSKQFKWMSKHDSSVWDLWTKIPKTGDKLILTSSRKDALCVWSNTGIPSLSLQGEGYVPKTHVMKQLQDRYEKIYILYDNDFQSDENHGHIYGKNLAEKFGLIQIEIPLIWGSKDPSDLVKNYGTKVLKNVIKELINE